MLVVEVKGGGEVEVEGEVEVVGPGVPPSETVGRVSWRLCCPCGQAEPPRAGSPLLGSLGTATGIDWTTACPAPAHSAMPP